MSRYGIETIAESVDQSTVCPFMRERGCENGNEDCRKCVKEWFADHDKQIRSEVIDEVNKILKDMYLEIANTVNGNDYTSKNDLVSVVASKCRRYASNRLKQLKGGAE